MTARKLTRRLTRKQNLVVELLRARGPMSALEVGAVLHAAWHEPPKHSEDEPCNWCEQEGKGVLSSVGLRAYVTQRRNPTRWEVRGGFEPGGYDPATAEIPY